MKSIYILSAFLIGLIVFSSCKKKDEKPSNPTTSTDDVVLKIAHTWNGGNFALNTDLVNVYTGDTMNFITFKYYISNIKLKKADGSWWSEADSYHLLDLSVSGSIASLTLANVPTGEYTDIQYVLGVDSLRNVSGAQSGDLSPSKGMFWSWNTGYIMTKAEGISPQAGLGSFSFHLGGYSGVNSVVSTKTHYFGSNSLSVNGTNNCEIVLSARPADLQQNGESVSSTAMVMDLGARAKTMSDAFHSSFTFETIYE